MQTDIRLLVCDDHELVRNGIVELLKSGGFLIAAEAQDGLQMIKLYEEIKPDVLIADLSMPYLSGLEAGKEILKKYPEAKILLLTMYSEEYFMVSSYQVGIKGLIGKDVRKEELYSAIREIASGGIYFGQEYTQEKLLEKIERYKAVSSRNTVPGELSRSEEQILDLFAEGMLPKEIAKLLRKSIKEIESTKEKIMERYRLKTLPALIKFAIERKRFKSPV